MTTTIDVQGATKGYPYKLEMIVKDDDVAVDMTSKSVTAILDTYDTELTKDQDSADVTRGADGTVEIQYTADEMTQRPGVYDLTLLFSDLVADETVSVRANFRIDGV